MTSHIKALETSPSSIIGWKELTQACWFGQQSAPALSLIPQLCPCPTIREGQSGLCRAMGGLLAPTSRCRSMFWLSFMSLASLDGSSVPSCRCWILARRAFCFSTSSIKAVSNLLMALCCSSLIFVMLLNTYWRGGGHMSGKWVWGHTWLCTQGLLLGAGDSGDKIRCWGLNVGWPHTCQMPSPLCCGSGLSSEPLADPGETL